jgi:hypothetical protein
MQWTANRLFVPPPLADRLDRVRLRRHALRYAAHGWAVTPGACLVDRRFAGGRPGCPDGPVRWVVPPERAQWRLPDPSLVQTLLTDALGTVREPRVTVPRQLSTARRAA